MAVTLDIIVPGVIVGLLIMAAVGLDIITSVAGAAAPQALSKMDAKMTRLVKN
jgi:hypothetical protein